METAYEGKVAVRMRPVVKYVTSPEPRNAQTLFLLPTHPAIITAIDIPLDVIPVSFWRE